MAANPDTARSAPPQTATPYALKWDPDPVVLVSRRARYISFPTLVLLREPTEADRRALEAPAELGKVRDESSMTVLSGVNFLGTLTTAWAPALHRAPSSAAAPKGPPHPDQCVLLAPASRQVNLEKRPGFFDRETGLPMPESVHAGWSRVLAWLRAQEDAQIAGPMGQANVPLFTPEPGFEAPEFVVCRVSEVLQQRTVAGRHAYQHAFDAVPFAKHGGHLGALHDYAVRGNAWPLVTACRARAQHAPSLLPRR